MSHPSPAGTGKRWLWHGLSLFCLSSAAALSLGGGLQALQVHEVSGTLLGGMGTLLGLSLLLPALLALSLAGLLGLSGARWMNALVFLLLGGGALYQWLLYPDAHNGNLIFSPSRQELAGMAGLCLLALMIALLVPARPRPTPGLLRWLLAGSLALTCLAGLLLAFATLRQSSLPNCAFDAHSGQQLSICLGDEPQVLID